MESFWFGLVYVSVVVQGPSPLIWTFSGQGKIWPLDHCTIDFPFLFLENSSEIILNRVYLPPWFCSDGFSICKAAFRTINGGEWKTIYFWDASEIDDADHERYAPFFLCIWTLKLQLELNSTIYFLVFVVRTVYRLVYYIRLCLLGAVHWIWVGFGEPVELVLNSISFFHLNFDLVCLFDKTEYIGIELLHFNESSFD